MVLMVRPRSRLGTLSTSSTRVMICQLVAPMQRAASITPPSTSSRLCSTMRATKGAAATVRGRLAALAPMEVPITARVKGVRNSIRIIKGMLRKMFTSQPKAALN